MTTTIGHISDMHGQVSSVLTGAASPDFWVSSGDFCPNWTRGIVSVEENYQANWIKENQDSIRTAFAGKPVLVVDGNHDFIPVGEHLRWIGVNAIDIPTDDGVEFMGFRFSGFPDIPYIVGEWNREKYQDELGKLVDRALACNPDILVTHAPPAGILAGEYGIHPLTAALTYRYHNIRLHLFGHVHDSGGKVVSAMEIEFSNAATTLNMLTIERQSNNLLNL
jgi:Icc-related predicted phosphoesterase